MYAMEKFRSHLLCSIVIIYNNYSALKDSLDKKDGKPRLVWYLLLLQEFGVEIKDKVGAENVIGGHLRALIFP